MISFLFLNEYSVSFPILYSKFCIVFVTEGPQNCISFGPHKTRIWYIYCRSHSFFYNPTYVFSHHFLYGFIWGQFFCLISCNKWIYFPYNQRFLSLVPACKMSKLHGCSPQSKGFSECKCAHIMLTWSTVGNI